MPLNLLLLVVFNEIVLLICEVCSRYFGSIPCDHNHVILVQLPPSSRCCVLG